MVAAGKGAGCAKDEIEGWDVVMCLGWVGLGWFGNVNGG